MLSRRRDRVTATYADSGYDCDGNCLNDTDGDGICDEFEVAGCRIAQHATYDADATDDDGSCTMPMRDMTATATAF
jgi:hypothetical protein